MRVLAHVHTFNDDDVIDGTIAALLAQSYPLDEILLVDNGSTDATLERAFPEKVTIIRHGENLGTNGTVVTGMQYAIRQGYEWIYILDADSAPEPEAIARLVGSYEGLSEELKARTWWLSSLQKEPSDGRLHHGCIFTPNGIEMLAPPPEPALYRCHTNMWSGSFYRLAAVEEVGLPDPDYVLDWGDVIYGYEGMVQGFIGFVDQASVVMHNLHVMETRRHYRFGRRRLNVYHSPPIRFYYLWRNSTYFWLYRYREGSFRRTVWPHFFMFLKWLVKATLFLRRPGPILAACLRGLCDGVRGRLDKRF